MSNTSPVIDDPAMNPNTSPSALFKANVKSLNNIPLYIVLAIICLFLIIVAFVAFEKSQTVAPTDEKKDNSSRNMAQIAKQFATDNNGLIPPANLPKAPTEKELTPIIVRPDNLDRPPLPPNTIAVPERSQRDDEINRIHAMKLAWLQEAIKSKTSVPVTAPRSNASSPLKQTSPRTESTDPTDVYKAKLAKIRGLPPENEDGSSSSTANYDQFGNPTEEDRWRLNQKTESPRSPYELRAGFVIPATLISGINSELPGQIMAQVSQSVYDTATGEQLLIPQGSRLVGAYSSEVKYGQARVLVAWQRIVFPDGKALDIGAMPGADSAGYSGFNDQVDNHYIRLFGSAIIMSAVTAGIAYSQQNNQGASSPYGYGTAPNANSAISQALGQQLGQVTAQMINKNMSISPTLEIRPGYRFNVIVTKDLTFTKPYKAFDY